MYSWRGLVNLYGVSEVDESVQDQSNTKFVSYPVIGSGGWIHQSLLSSIPLVFCAFTTSQSIHVARWKHSLVCIELVVLLRIPLLLLFTLMCLCSYCYLRYFQRLSQAVNPITLNLNVFFLVMYYQMDINGHLLSSQSTL